MKSKLTKFLTKEYLINAYYCIFLFAILYQLFNQIIIHRSRDNYNITEWLINYQGGFVRRGLPGEILYQISTKFGIEPTFIITIISLVFFGLLIIFFARKFISKGYPIFILPFSFLLGFPVLNDLWLRKDSLILLFFIALIYIFQKKSKGYFIWLNLVFIIGILSHELLAIFSFPILFFLLYSRYKLKFESFFTPLLYSFFFILPSLITFLTISFFKGNEQIAMEIWNSWDKVYPDKIPMGSSSAVSAIGWSFTDTAKFTIKMLFHKNADFYAFVGFFIQILVVFFISINTNSLNNKILKYSPIKQDQLVITSVVLFQAIFALIPMCIIASDYGRWTYLWIMSSFIVLLIVPSASLKSAIPVWYKSYVNKIYDLITRIFGNSKGVVILLCLLITQPYAAWNINNIFSTSSLYVVITFITGILRSIVLIFTPIS